MLLVDNTTLNGRYTLGRMIGKGGMGAVYEADDVALQRRVAVKVLSPELARGRSALGRFEREAKAASAIRTEHIVRVLDADVDQATGSPFLVMELLRGEDLAHLLDRLGPLPPGLALRIVAQACVGLEKAHEAGVVHRDIKPANLFLARREDGGLVVKLLDFGVAKIRPAHDPRRDTTGLTWSGHVLGTPRYMSPEQARGIKDIDHRTDLWSLGVVLYRALAGRTPTEDVKAVGELITALVADLPAPVQDFAPWVPPEVAAVLDGALQYQPADRYPSASAMRDALLALLGEDPLSLDESLLVPLAPSERLTVAPRFEPRVRARAPRRPMSGAGGAQRWKDLPLDSGGAPADEPTLSRDYGIHGEPTLSRDHGIHGEPTLSRDHGIHGEPTLGRDHGIHGEPTLGRDHGIHGEPTLGRDHRVDERPERRPSEPAPPPHRERTRLRLSAFALLAAALGGAAMPWPAGAPGAAPTGWLRAMRGALEAPSVERPAPSPTPEASPFARRIGRAITTGGAPAEIDRAPAARKDGTAALPGIPGEVGHALEGAGETEVIVTDAGVAAAKRMQASRRASGSPARKPRPAAAASAAPAAAPPPADASNPLLPQRFE
ncbi:protein kinase domain-containing protein [Sorangium sp. So ce861]|uniref:serine/threonine-protein kinase n=1 Tax=Sorangium sp. So ce861 TaxID=3133323 RepID=UPI003F6087C1